MTTPGAAPDISYVDAIATLSLLILIDNDIPPDVIWRDYTTPRPHLDALHDHDQLQEFGCVYAPAAAVKTAMRLQLLVIFSPIGIDL